MAKDFKVEEKKETKIDFSIFEEKAKIAEAKKAFNETGIKLQTYLTKTKDIPYAKKRLFGEYFNILCSALDCLSAIESVTE